MDKKTATNIGLLLCWLARRNINFSSLINSSFSLTGRYRTEEYILYFGFSIGCSCQPDNYKIPAQHQAQKRCTKLYGDIQ